MSGHLDICKTFLDSLVDKNPCIKNDNTPLTSVTQKNVPSALVIYYCAWYVFLRDRRYTLQQNMVILKFANYFLLMILKATRNEKISHL